MDVSSILTVHAKLITFYPRIHLSTLAKVVYIFQGKLDYFTLKFQTLGSISPTFYEQLLSAQIPKVQITQSNQVAFCTFQICKRESCL